METLTKTSASLLAAALEYAERGWHVFPIAPGCKKPPAINKWEQRATIDPARIEACWGGHTPWNIGIACGPSGLVVIDLDMPKPAPGELFVAEGTPSGIDQFTDLCRQQAHGDNTQARLVSTSSGGLHLYYTHPSIGPQLRSTTRTLASAIDTRAHGGYIVAPPSVISTMGAYRVVRDVEPPPLPKWLATLLTPTPAPTTMSPQPISIRSDRKAAYLCAAIDRQIAHLKAAGAQGEGRRNITLWASAVALGQLVAGRELDEQDVYNALEPVARDIGLYVIETKKTIASGLRRGAQNPRTVANRD